MLRNGIKNRVAAKTADFFHILTSDFTNLACITAAEQQQDTLNRQKAAADTPPEIIIFSTPVNSK